MGSCGRFGALIFTLPFVFSLGMPARVLASGGAVHVVIAEKARAALKDKWLRNMLYDHRKEYYNGALAPDAITGKLKKKDKKGEWVTVSTSEPGHNWNYGGASEARLHEARAGRGVLTFYLKRGPLKTA